MTVGYSIDCAIDLGTISYQVYYAFAVVELSGVGMLEVGQLAGLVNRVLFTQHLQASSELCSHCLLPLFS